MKIFAISIHVLILGPRFLPYNTVVEYLFYVEVEARNYKGAQNNLIMFLCTACPYSLQILIRAQPFNRHILFIGNDAYNH